MSTYDGGAGVRFIFGGFGLLFALVWLVACVLFNGEELGNAWRVRSWVESPATLVAVSRQGSSVGATYTYQYQGRRYEGKRVGFYDHWSGASFTPLHRTNFGKLRTTLEASGPVRAEGARGLDGTLRATGAGAPISIWLDPSNPRAAVIDPLILWDRLRDSAMIAAIPLAIGLMFAVVGFSAGGGGGNGAGAFAMRVPHPIRGSSQRFPTAGWAVGFAWNAIVMITSSDFRPTPGNTLLAWLALGLFGGVGVYILWRCLLATLRWQRYRGIVLALDPYPGVAGGVVAGSLLVPVRFERENRFRFTLRCTEIAARAGIATRAGETKQARSARRVLFEAEGLAKAVPAPGGTRLSFSIPVPAEAPGSDGYLEGIYWTPSTMDRVFICWTLELSADVVGVDLEEEFEIPVRALAPGEMPRVIGRPVERVAETGAGFVSAASMPLPMAALSRPAAPSQTRRAQGATGPGYLYERVGSKIRITQPAWRKPVKMTSLSGLVFGLGPSLGFVAIGVILLREGELMGGAAFFLFGAAVVLLFLGYLGHALGVEIDDEGVTIEHRLFGFLVNRVELGRAQVAEVQASAESAASDGRSGLTRSVKLRLQDGSSWMIAFLIPKARDALALRNLVAARLAVGVGGSATVAPRTVRTSESPGAVDEKKTSSGLRYAGILVVLIGVGYQAWPFLKSPLGLDDSLPVQAPQTVQAPATVSSRPPAPAIAHASAEPVPEADTGDWFERFRRGQQASSEQRPQEALSHYRSALAEVEATLGANDLRAALMLDRISALLVNKRNYAEAEQVLRRALAILEAQSHAQIRDFGRVLVPGFDRESVQRRLAWTLWELRRYADSLAAYQRAYDMLDELDLGEATYNARRAYNAAGIMAAACTQGQWERADRAMAELKQRIRNVSARDRQSLDYWVRTGEPRLAARKC